MKYYLLRYWPYLLALLGFLIVGGILNQKDKLSNEIFLGGIVTIITIFISIINYYHSSDQFFKELFTEFNQRYDKMNNFLFSIQDTDTLDMQQRDRVIDYLNLCAEEYMWVKKGRIPLHIWRSWRNGIQIHLNKRPIRTIFDEERALWKSSYYGFFDEIKF